MRPDDSRGIGCPCPEGHLALGEGSPLRGEPAPARPQAPQRHRPVHAGARVAGEGTSGHLRSTRAQPVPDATRAASGSSNPRAAAALGGAVTTKHLPRVLDQNAVADSPAA